ncbi:MAG: NAD(P)-dependent oxidoreductase [Ferruginibacter sp.]
MKVVLAGASGFVGKAILKELLQKGHDITGVVRDAKNLEPQKGLVIKEMDVNNVDEFAEVITGNDAVISAFNAGWTNPNLYEDFLKGSQAIQDAVKKSGINRLLIVGGAGSLFIDGKQLVDSPDFPEAYKAGATAARDYLNDLKNETELDWVFVSPAVEMHPGTSGSRRGTYRTGSDNPVFDENGKSIISVEDLAVAIVDEMEKPAHHRERFTVAY